LASLIVFNIFVVVSESNPPLPSTPEDEFIGELVRLYYKRKPLVEQVKKLLSEDGAKEPLTRQVNIAVRQTILDFWANMGGKEFAYGKKDQGYQKMGEYLEQQKAKRRKGVL
jgi:hypothetical protein